MIVEHLTLKNFRNIPFGEFFFSDRINIFGGNNAQGKTNLMEALACALEKSFRTLRASELVPDGSRLSPEMSVDFRVDAYPEKINILSCRIDGSYIKRKINGINYKEAVKLYPQLKVIVFIPEDLYIVKGSPDMRRELIDETADMMNKKHHVVSSNYLRILRQKNTFLVNSEKRGISETDQIQLSVWNEELAKAGVNVTCGRKKYFSTLSNYTSEFYSQLNNNKEKLTLKYHSSVFSEEEYENAQPEEMYEIYSRKLEEKTERELAVCHTLVGVHRDDIEFFIDGRPARDYASQGQIRSAAVALRLAQAKMFRERWGEAPIIILDDVLSELDETRRSFILSHIVESQVFITGCNKNDFAKIAEARRWEAENGVFTQIDR